MNIKARFAFFSIFALSAIVPLSVEAGFFSVVKDLFSSNVSALETNNPNSQNMALLQAAVAPLASSTSETVSIIDESSLFLEAHTPYDSKEYVYNNGQISVYVVREGDKLSDIAKIFNVNTNTIIWANDLKGTQISPGQELVILPISGINHTVKSGDTLQGIAKKYSGDLEEILQYNNLAKDSKIAIGDKIFIPDGEILAVSTKTTTSSSSFYTKTSSGSVSVSGYFIRPIVGGVRTQGIHGHNGVDLASYLNAKIMAAADGEVIISKNSGWNGGYGSYIVIKHSNGTQTLYGHLNNTAISVGQKVSQGDTIGYMGSTGKSTGIHLHFEVRGGKNPF